MNIHREGANTRRMMKGTLIQMIGETAAAAVVLRNFIYFSFAVFAPSQSFFEFERSNSCHC